MALTNVVALHRGGVDGQRIRSGRLGAPVTIPPPEFSSRGTDLDPAVVRRFCAGDRGALAAVFDHFSRAVYSVARSVLRDKHLADDATQETFVRAWKSAGSFDPARPMAPWLLTIARRTALDVYRREYRPTRGDHAEETDAPVSPAGIEQTWEVWEIKLALDQLPDEERDVVRLAHFGGMSHPQIAEALNVPVGTVKSRSFRAHKRLAGLLAHMMDPNGEPV